MAGRRPLGYDCLKVNSFFKQGDCDAALRVLHLNAEEYTADWNVFDSYSEACMKAGKKDLAIGSYERALALDPSQENPRAMLRQLRQR